MVYCSLFVVTPVRWVVRPLLMTVIVKSTTILIENHTSINGVGALDNITDSSLVIREDYILNITSTWSIIYHNAALKRLRCYAKLIVIFPDNFRIIISSTYHMHKRNVQIRIGYSIFLHNRKTMIHYLFTQLPQCFAIRVKCIAIRVVTFLYWNYTIQPLEW